MPTAYKHLVFDLDHTLWDFETSSNETLGELHEKHELEAQNIDLKRLTNTFHRINGQLWEAYNANHITSNELREIRFNRILEEFSIKNTNLAEILSHEYLEICPTKPYLLPFAKEILEELSVKYPLHILTNGFPDIQRTKMTSGGILHYFENIVTSAESGCKKPEKQAFMYVVDLLDVQPNDCLMIGDNAHADIAGAYNAGMDTVWFNPERQTAPIQPTYQISSLKELLEFL